jgi:hypothetical protein
LRDGRFRWTLYENGQVRNRSATSYATEHEALADATKVLDKQIANWRSATDDCTASCGCTMTLVRPTYVGTPQSSQKDLNRSGESSV